MKNNFKMLIIFISLILLTGNSLLSAQVTTPQNVKATVQSNLQVAGILITWDKQSMMSGHHMGYGYVPPPRYDIYKKTGAPEDTGSYSIVLGWYAWGGVLDVQVERGKTYSYYIVAVQGDTSSAASSVVSVTVPLLVMGTISGTVTSDADNSALKGVRIQVVSSASCYRNPDVYTDSLGNFSIKLLAGDYYLYLSKIGYFSEYYGNTKYFRDAAKITLAGNDVVTANTGLASFVLPTTKTVSGNVTDETGTPVRANVSIYKLRNNTYHWSRSSSFTDSLGNYSFKALSGDTIVVYAAPLNKLYLPQFFEGKSTYAEATRLVVSGDLANINFTLALKSVLPNGISGLVLDTAMVGVPAHVSAIAISNGRVKKQYAAVADSLGKYSFGNIAPGSYLLRVYPMNGYAPTYYRYDGLQSLDWKTADTVVVDSFSVVSNIDFIVVPRSDSGFASVHGTVKSNNHSVSGASVYAMDENGKLISYAISDANGIYKMTDVSIGKVRIVSDMAEYNSATSPLITLGSGSASSTVSNLELVQTPAAIVYQTSSSAPTSFILEQNYPNPFNPSTLIKYSITENAFVNLKVFDELGREVTTLVNAAQSLGSYEVKFNAAGLSSGVYLYRLQAGDQVITRKLMLMK